MPLFDSDEFDARRRRSGTTVTGTATTAPLTPPTAPTFGTVNAPGIAPGENNPTSAPAPTGPRTNVYEPIGADRLANPNTASPKDLFLSKAQNYQYNQLGDLLKDLQSDPTTSRYFQGWSAASPDVMRYTGDPSKMASEWGGVDSFDVIAGYDKTNNTAQGWRWGVGEGGGMWGLMNNVGAPSGGGLSGISGSGLEALLAMLGPNQRGYQAPAININMPALTQPTTVVPPTYQPQASVPTQYPVESSNPAEMPLMDGQTEPITQALSTLAMQMPQLFNRGAQPAVDPLAQAVAQLMGARY